MFQQHPARAPKCFGNSAAKAVSITQVVCGGIAIVLGIAIIFVRPEFSYTGYPIWTGALFLSTGIVGIFAAIRKTKCMMTSFMILSIVSAVFTTLVLGFAITAAAVDQWSRCWGFEYNCYDRPAWLAMDGLLIVLGLLEAGLSITSSVMTCYAICSCCEGENNCCSCENSGNQSTAVAYTVGADGRLVQIPGQYVMAGGQAIAMTSFPPSQPQQSAVLPTGATAQQPMFVTQAPANMAAGRGNAGSGQNPNPQRNVVLVPTGHQAQGGAPTPPVQRQMFQPTVGHGGNIQYVFPTPTPIQMPQAVGQQQPQSVQQVQFQQPQIQHPIPSPQPVQSQPQQQMAVPQHGTTAQPTTSSPPPSYQPTDPGAPRVNEGLNTKEDAAPLIDVVNG